jgi:hypothetical protein
VRYSDTIPALLEHANDIVDGVAGMAAKLREMVSKF